MANGDLLKIILNTINDVQKKNKANPKEETASPNIFDMLKDKIGGLEKKTNQSNTGAKPTNIIDLIKSQIEAAKQQNKQDPNTPTADSAIFDRIMKKVEAQPKKVASTGLKRIIENYHLDVSGVDKAILKQVKAQYDTDIRKIDQQYAEAMHKVIQRSK